MAQWHDAEKLRVGGSCSIQPWMRRGLKKGGEGIICMSTAILAMTGAMISVAPDQVHQ